MNGGPGALSTVRSMTVATIAPPYRTSGVWSWARIASPQCRCDRLGNSSKVRCRRRLIETTNSFNACLGSLTPVATRAWRATSVNDVRCTTLAGST